jgi:hypothetical protein
LSIVMAIILLIILIILWCWGSNLGPVHARLPFNRTISPGPYDG